ncbi:MAG TPA: response regulator [Actinomycetota bacterium]
MSDEGAASRPEPGDTRILVVDDDPDIARFVEVNLRGDGYAVEIASNGDQGLEKALANPPDLALVDVMMPGMDGFQLVERLRTDPRTAGMSIIMLTAKSLTADKVLGLTTGADDYIIKPFDPVELMARVKGTLRRAEEMRASSPLTGLPGNVRIQDEIARAVASGRPFALVYADLDNFKAYNDYYGFLRGDAAIKTAARIFQDETRGVVGESAFVGHMGGDDFVLLVPPEKVEDLCHAIIERFDGAMTELYDDEDRERGYIEIRSRRGDLQRFPLVSLSLGVATTERRSFTHREEAVAIATEMKNYAKRSEGSSWAIDRRSAGS